MSVNQDNRANRNARSRCAFGIDSAIPFDDNADRPKEVTVIRYSMAVAIAMFFAVGLAQAQEKAFDWSACKIELAKYCKDIKGNEKTYQCLEEHDKDLSAQCEASHAKYEQMTGKKKK
jgi:hypothetical protein